MEGLSDDSPPQGVAPAAGALTWRRGWRLELAGPAETDRLAAHLARHLAPPRVVALVGAMGAGKTRLVRGVAQALGGVDMDEVASPTYALMHLYPSARGPLVHLDLWRLASAEMARAMGLEEAMADPQAMVLVEWAERAPALLPADAWAVRLEVLGAEARRATVVGPPPAPGATLPEEAR